MNRNRNELLERLKKGIESASERYHKLVLVIGLFYSGKTDLLLNYERMNPNNTKYINLNYELTRHLIDIPSRKIPFESERYLKDIFNEFGIPFLLVDHIELLFDPILLLNPLRLLQILSRSKTLVVAWPGRYKEGKVSYAEPGYREYKVWSIKDLVIIDLNEWMRR